MKITIVTGPFLSVPPAPCGAVERLWNDLSAEFVRKGHQVTIISRDHELLASRDNKHNIQYRTTMKLNATKSLSLNLIKDLIYSLRVLFMLPKADILVTNTFWLPALAPIMRPSAGRVDVHVARVPKGQMKMYVRAGAARISAVSSAIKNWIVEQCPAAESRTRVILNAIDTTNFSPPKKPRQYNGEQVIIYTGRIHPEKGIPILIDAFKILYEKHQNIRLECYGPYRIEAGGGGKAFRDELIKRAEALPVNFHEPLYDRKALADALRAGHYFCYPSTAEKGEACPIAPLEAMGTGLIPIVSDLPQFGDYLAHEKNGLRFNHRGSNPANNLEEAFLRLIENPGWAQELSRAAANDGARYSNSSIAEQYLKDFEEIIAPDDYGAPASARG